MAKPAKKKSARKTADLQRAHVLYAGRVQGVGFRHTAEEIALRLGVVGWVKNLHDGRVEVVAEGEKELLNEFLEKILESHLGPHIKKNDLCWEQPTGEFSDFCVEFCF